jgi:ketosteroid isomerase-like protein
MEAQPNARDTVKKFFEAVNRRDFEAVASVLSEDFAWTEPFLGERQGTGREALVKDAKSFIDNMPDVVFEVGNLIAEGNRAGFELTAARKQTGAKTTYALFVEVDEAGQLSRIREYYDRKLLMKQLGFEAE